MDHNETLETLNQQFPCRTVAIQALASLLDPDYAIPPAIVIHGLDATGKSSITRAVLHSTRIPHAIVDSRECITARHLLEQASALSRQAALAHAAADDAAVGALARCETVNTLENQLERFLRGIDRFALVFDGIDRQREMAPVLMPGLARLGHLIPNLCVVFIISIPSPRMFLLPGIPHIHFSTYDRDETLQIVGRHPLAIFETLDDPDYSADDARADNAWLWSRFTTVVWDSIGKGAARDLRSFTTVCHKLWRPFVQPIVDNTFGTRDFTKLLISKRALFQGEEFLTGTVLRQSKVTVDQRSKKHELPYYTKFILCAAYLASYNPARQDKIYFMKASERRKRKRGGAPGRASKHRKIPRHQLTPSPFPLDRLLAILHALLPHALPPTAQILAQIATLASLRLLVRTGAGADVLDPAVRFRVQCSWDYVASLGRSVGVEMRDYLAG